MATSQRPVAMSRAAAATEWVPAAHAVTTHSEGPRHPTRIEIWAAPALAIIMGTRNGETRFAPAFVEDLDLLLERVESADARGEHHAGPGGVDLEASRVLEGHVGARDAELGEAVQASRLLGPEPLQRVEVGDPPLALDGGPAELGPQRLDCRPRSR